MLELTEFLIFDMLELKIFILILFIELISDILKSGFFVLEVLILFIWMLLNTKK